MLFHPALNELVATLAEVGPEECRAADHLRELIRRFDLAQVRTALQAQCQSHR
jgi:hypothetical protein